MSELSANRTLVKSPPELWAELSEVERLAEHLGEFGQIRITKTEPEKTVAWEGEHGSGTVEIAASGWGTKVTLTAALAEPPVPEAASDPDPAPEPEAAPEPQAASEPQPLARPPQAEQAPWAPAHAPPDPHPAPAPHWSAAPPPPPQWTPPRRPEPPRRGGRISRLFGRRPAEPPRHAWQAQEPVRPEPPSPPAWEPPAPPPQAAVRLEPLPAAPPPAPPPTPAPAAAPPKPAPPPPEPERAPEPGPTLDADRALAVLEGALDTLGSAHHRPFSRG